MNPLIKNWQLTILGLAIIIGLVLIFNPFSGNENTIEYTNIKLGLEFKGGTIFTVELQDPIDTFEMQKLISTMQLRIDPSGLQDYTIRSVGDKFIVVEVAETDSEKIALIENRIRQQGKFEANLNGEIVFTGDNIKRILKTNNYSYGVSELSGGFRWSLPFVLDEAGAKSFMDKTFHQCVVISTDSTGKPVYDCEKTIFFLDKPNAIILIDSDTYYFDEELLFKGNSLLNIPEQTIIEKVIEDAIIPVIIYDSNSFDISALDKNFNKIIVSNAIPVSLYDDLNQAGFEVITNPSIDGQPWIWNALNAKQIISLTEGITNQDVSSKEQAKIIYELVISGQSQSANEAFDELNNLTILLESGSLPTPVKSISQETISPSLGENFLSTVIMMGILALIVVGLVIVIRYKQPILIIPIVLFGLIEVLLNIAFLANTGRPLDLAAFAGLIIAIGTGVDSEIVITDQILSKSQTVKESLITRAKRAIFIITISALTMIAVMGPIVLFSRTYPGIEKLYGFAVVAIVGALIGAFITRPAFTKIMEKLYDKKE
jgi:preprotein translocase subunit SecD